MPTLELLRSAHAPEISPVAIHYREFGRGSPLVFLHGGWGYGVYPITRQIKAFKSKVRFIIPDRSGYGRSTPVSAPMPIDFHQRAAEETLLVLDKLGIKRAMFWGHSDGAVIATMIGLLAPQRCSRLILEAFHFYRGKLGSRKFFQRFADHPEEVSEKLQRLLVADHGEEQWKRVVQRNCRVWLELAAESTRLGDDLYDAQLSGLQGPVMFMHGRHDPRTEPGEIERAHEAVAGSDLHFIEDGRHSPHSEEAAWGECNRILRELIV